MCIRDSIEDLVLEVKRRYKDPFILVAGDFNQLSIDKALEDFPDMREASIGPTRKDRCLDRIFCNFSRAVKSSGSVPPLEVEPDTQGSKSDHRVAYIEASLPKIRTYQWETYSYRYKNPESEAAFGRWLAGFDWAEFASMVDSNLKAEYYQEAVISALERFFRSLQSGEG